MKFFNLALPKIFQSKGGVSAPQASAFPKGAEYANITNSQELSEFLSSGGVDTFAGEKVGLHEAMKVAAVYRCVNILANISATARIYIKDKETFECRGVEDDLVYMLNDMPNDHMNAYNLRRTMELQKLLRGNAYARVVRGFRGRALSLELMHTDQVEVRELRDRSLEYTYSSKHGDTLVLPQDEVLHIMGPSYDGIIGHSALSAARNQIGLSLASEKHSSSLFKNGTNIGDILTNEKELGKEAVEFLKSSLEDYRGADNGHKTLILQGGMKYDKVGMSQVDAEFVASRKLGVIELCMFFGVPPHIAGFNEGQIYGNGVEHTGIAFVNYTIVGDHRGWEAAIKQTLLIGNRREMVDLDDSNLMRGDTKSRWESYRIARETGVMNANDINRAERRPIVDGGDVYWTQPNLARGAENEPQNTA